MIDARGIYRDPVRSSLGHFVKTSGLRWLCFTLLTPLPWKTGIKALPFQALLAPSERYASKRGLRHKKLTDWARQGMLQTIRWLPDRKVIFVGDSSFGTHDLANSISKAQFANCRDGPIIVMTRYDLGGNFSRTYRSNHRK